MVHQLFLAMTWMGSEWVLVTLGLLSIAMVGVILSRWFELSRLLRASDRFWSEHAEGWFQNADTRSWQKELPELLHTYPCVEVETLDLLNRAPANADSDKMVSAFLGRKKMKLERKISVLGTIGANGPFVGLLGTVLGIIKAFSDIATKGAGGGMEMISGGISEALVATAIGLMVAIPAIVFFNVLNKRVAKLIRRADDLSQFVDAEFTGGDQSDAPKAAAGRE